MKEHLYEIDLMRAFIILGVLCVHNFSFYNLFNPDYSTANTALEMGLATLHFTRESFMFITGLVLFITYYRKTFTAKDFLLKRFKLIAIPYAFWTIAYILFSGTYVKGFEWTAPHLYHVISNALLTGNQFFLYYLLISMQFYVVFPMFLKWMKKMAKWHVWIFFISFFFELFLMWLNKAYIQNLDITHLPGIVQWLIFYRDRNLITYQFWFVAGAVVAIHYNPIKEFVVKHTKAIFISFIFMLGALWIHFGVDHLLLNQDHTMSDLVLQPIMIPYSAVVTAVLWRAGIAWADNRHKVSMRWFSSFVKTVAAASFGVFLVHPFMLHFVEVFVYQVHPSVGLRMIMLPMSIIFVYGMSILIATGIGKIPFLSYVVGQKTRFSKWHSNLSRSA